jgi:hypothetical protein
MSVVAVAGMIGATAVIWFVFLSGWLGVQPASVLLTRENVLFNSDTNTWIEEMVNNPDAGAGTRAIHPLAVALWRPPTRMLFGVLRAVLPRERAGPIAARLVIALVAGAGVGSLAWLALTIGVAVPQLVLLFAMYLLFTASSTIALPEHFGLSSGLLSITFVAPILLSHRRTKAATLALLVLVCGGTTITNALYPLGALYQWVLERRARRWIAISAAFALPVSLFFFIDSQLIVRPYIPGTAAPLGFAHRSILPAYIPAAARWYAKTSQIHGHVLGFANLRLLNRPMDAFVYATYALVAPAVGPSPAVRKTKGSDMVTYESSQPLRWTPVGSSGSDRPHLRDYLGVQAVGAVLWMGLFLYCAQCAFRCPTTRRLAWLPAGWIVFNLLFHNLWGDELFLYAPHWSWALMALVVLGARDLSRWVIASLVIPIAACQLYTLVQIKSALLMIYQ